MTLDELKAEMVNLIDKAWSVLGGTSNLDAARAVVADTTATLTEHAHAAGQQLFDHVAANAAAAATSAESAPVHADTAASVAAPVEEAPTQELAPVAEAATEPSA